MKLPAVSVIMATFNHASFVTESIESVLKQRDANFEFLIADDGSSDLTRDVIASIKDDRIRFFPNEQNRGACIVTNELIERARGEYIALINSDDCWSSPEKLAYQVRILRENPLVGACFGRANFVDEGGKEINKGSVPSATIFDQENRSQGRWLRKFFEYGNCICHPTMLIRRACYGQLGMYNNRLRQLPDYDMWVRLVRRYDIFISDLKLVNFRILPGENVSSWTVKNSVRMSNEHFLIANNFFQGVTREQLIDGFGDLLTIKDLPTEYHLDIETAKLFFVENKRLGKPYKMIGLIKMYQLLNDPKYHQLLTGTCQTDDRWFQQQMGEIDVLRPRIIEEIKGKKRRIKAGVNRLARFFGQPTSL